MNCKNCHTQLEDDFQYCNKCGGKVIRNRLTFRNLFEHISETFFNYDNKLLRTIIDLIKTPEEVIGGYIDGVRKRHVNPISFFGLTLTLIGIEWLILRTYFTDQLNVSSLATSGNESNINSLFETLQDYSSILMILLVPIYALISRIVFFDNKKYNYVEHIVAFTYMMAFLSLIGAVINFVGVSFGLDMGNLSFINLPVQVIYITYCLKRLYKLNSLEIFTRMLLSFVVYFIFYILSIVLFLGCIYLFQGEQAILDFIESYRPK